MPSTGDGLQNRPWPERHRGRPYRATRPRARRSTTIPVRSRRPVVPVVLEMPSGRVSAPRPPL